MFSPQAAFSLHRIISGSTVSVLHTSQSQNLMSSYPRSLGNFQSFMSTALFSSASSLPSFVSSQFAQTWPDGILSSHLPSFLIAEKGGFITYSLVSGNELDMKPACPAAVWLIWYTEGNAKLYSDRIWNWFVLRFEPGTLYMVDRYSVIEFQLLLLKLENLDQYEIYIR